MQFYLVELPGQVELCCCEVSSTVLENQSDDQEVVARVVVFPCSNLKVFGEVRAHTQVRKWLRLRLDRL